MTTDTSSDPEGHDSLMTYLDGGLLNTFTNARGLTSTMEYDAAGRLQTDTDPAAGSHTLVRAESGIDWTVQRTTALGRTTTYEAVTDSGGRLVQTISTPASDESSVDRGSDQVTRRRSADGTVVSVSESPDARLGLNAPVLAQTTTLPSGLASTETSVPTYNGLSSTNILSFTTMTDQRTVNGNTWATTYNALNRTFTSTSPEARTTTRIIDTLGRTTRTR